MIFTFSQSWEITDYSQETPEVTSAVPLNLALLKAYTNKTSVSFLISKFHRNESSNKPPEFQFPWKAPLTVKHDGRLNICVGIFLLSHARSCVVFFLFFFVFFVFLLFLGPLQQHMEVPRLGVELEL